jgi:hypothetical protein
LKRDLGDAFADDLDHAAEHVAAFLPRTAMRGSLWLQARKEMESRSWSMA